ncbi:MAG: hypothetical protein M3436_00685 [Pseudomonadota bacterium]|nr:hypothetical protein [Pseudomonadota bacterium]
MSNQTANYSPKLREAMSEIIEIIKRHDIAAHVVLYEDHLSEFLLAIDPSWSMAWFEGPGLRIRSKLEDYGGDRDAQRTALERTVGMLRHFSDLAERDHNLFEAVLADLGRRFDIEHTGGEVAPRSDH